ncbi:aminotransferase class I/II-fold pyridoxal phosphate-dependent enzyme [Ferdinandcohnia sp. Marseille-Q9671]
MNQHCTPLFDALDKHAKKQTQSMHVPGHKYGQVFSNKGNPYFQKLLEIDVTELSGLDDLHQPEGVILEAETLLAELYGVENSFFLVNGSTVGNLAMILATCSANDTVLVQRNSHKSIINGLQLAGVRPVFLHPEYDSDVQVASYVSFETVRRAFQTYHNIKAIILTSPNYYGMLNPIELRKIITYAHTKNVAVLIDEAHGAHFLMEGFPASASSLGADIVVQSAHKTLPAMTMGSYMHVNSRLVRKSEVEKYLRMLQTSSPSYPIMASLDLARHYLASVKKKGSTEIRKKIEQFIQKLKTIQQLKVVTSRNPNLETDLLKVTIQSQCEANGFQLQSLFEQEGLYTELADPNNVLLVLPLSSTFDDEEAYVKVKRAVKNFIPEKRDRSDLLLETEKITTLSISYNEIKGYNRKTVSLQESIGKISGEMIIPYPPGVPLLMEGENITRQHIDLLETYVETGARFQGWEVQRTYIHILDK